MENDQNIVYRFSKITTQIKLVVLWVSLIILYSYTDIFYSLFKIIKYSPITERIHRSKSLALYIADLREIIYMAITIIALTPVLIIIANIFIKKNLINYINIIVGFIYAIIGVIILFRYDSNSLGKIIICITEALILILIIIISIQRLKIKKV
jgi:hypothetical protein